MTKLRNSLNGGTNNVGITTGNSGGASGDAFTAVEVAAVFSNEQSHSASLSMKPPSTTTTGLARWAASGDRTMAFRIYCYYTAAHVADYQFGQILAVNSSTAAATLMVQSTNLLRLRNNTTSVNVWTAANSLPLNQWVRIESLVNQGTTTSDGQLRMAYYLGDSTTAVEDSGWITAQNLKGDLGALNGVRFSKISANTYSGSAYYDDPAVNTGTDYAGFIGPELPPVVSPTYRWDGTKYVALDSYRWDGAAYVALDRATV